jgi:hypothetical protein
LKPQFLSDGTGKKKNRKMKIIQSIYTSHPLRLGWLCTFLLCSAQIFTQTGIPVSYNNCNSFIRIHGGSNISTFSFIYSTSSLSGAWQFIEIKDTGFLSVTVPVRDFEASNPLMYDDFLKLIKAREFPVLKIIIPKEQLDRSFKNERTSCPDIEIMLAGVTRIYNIDCDFYACGNNLFIRGLKMLKLSDFNIQPPVKLNGLVKVKDEIEVNFGLIITFDGENQKIASR